MRIGLWAGIFVALLAVSIGLDQTVRHRLQNLTAAQTLFMDAISQTKQDLLIKMGEVASDSTISQHLTWGLAHSVRSTLESHIANGKLDQVVLWTKAGTETGHARDIAIKRPFDPGKADLVTDRWTWLHDTPTPEILMLRPLMGSSANIYVSGSVTLGQAWLNLFPSLQKRLKELDLQIVPGTAEGITILEGSDSQTAPKIISLRPSDRWLLRMHRTFGTNVIPSIWPSLVLSVTAVILALRQKKRKLTAVKNEATAHMIWCLELTGERATEEFLQKTDFDANLCRKKIEAALAQKNTVQHELQEKILSLGTRIQLLEDDLRRRQKQLVAIAPFQSMAVQITALMDPFLSQLEDFEKRTKSITSHLQGMATSAAEKLGLAMQRWKDDIQARGSRKFIRSLAETAGREPGLTALDDEIATIKKTSEEIVEASETAVLAMTLITQKSALLKAHAEQWDGIKDHQFSQDHAGHPLDTVKEAQDMIETMLENQGESVEFIHHPATAPVPSLPPSPRHVWVAGIFHVLQAFHLYREGPCCRISTRLRQHGERGLLVLQGRKGECTQPQKSEQRLTPVDLIELSRTLLSPYGVSIQPLPQKDAGILAIAIGWPLSSDELKKGDRVAASHPDRLSIGETMGQ